VALSVALPVTLPVASRGRRRSDHLTS
jgi:hypothetical protein